MQSVVNFAQVPFMPIDTNFVTDTLIIPASPLHADVLLVSNSDYVFANEGQDSALAKPMIDFLGVIADMQDKDANWIFAGHEVQNTKNTVLGDGGGLTLFKIRYISSGGWRVVPSVWDKKYINVDFSEVGGINRNCSGTVTPYGNILLAEEFPVGSNSALYAGGMGFSDTSDFIIPAGNGMYSGSVLKKYQQMGWITEVDPKHAKAVRKIYAMGNFSHEDMVCMDDGKTVYLTEDNSPACFYKFISDEADNYVSGQLYVFRQSEDAGSGEWIALPMELDSLLNIKYIALQHGATLFSRLEGICKNTSGTKLYFSETGSDACNYEWALLAGGKMAKQITYLDTLYGAVQDSILQDYYGRVWQFDTETNACAPLIEGGTASDGITNLANPDNLEYVSYAGGKEYLFIQEDLNGISYGRQPSYITDGYAAVPEMYCLDMSIPSPTVETISRFALGPKGSEIAGVSFNTNGNVLFMNIMHPSSANPFPYNNSITVAVTGLKYFLNHPGLDIETPPAQNTIQIFPNPADNVLHFSSATDVSVFDASGKYVFSEQNTTHLNTSSLAAGIYFLYITPQQLIKVIIQ